MQYLFFSRNNEFMLERLANSRVFLYQRKRDFKGAANRVKWEQVHRFTQFPVDLADLTQYPYIFSPNFSNYIDVDRKAKIFMIKDSLT